MPVWTSWEREKKPVAVTITSVDIVTGIYPIVEEQNALAMYDLIGNTFVGDFSALIVEWKIEIFMFELALEAGVRILVIALGCPI